MKTKREVLEEFAKNGDCENINCKKECPYCFSDKCPDLDLRKIGAMAILRMFPSAKDTIEELEKENEQPIQRGCHNCKHDKESPIEICDACLYGYRDNWELAE